MTSSNQTRLCLALAGLSIVAAIAGLSPGNMTELTMKEGDHDHGSIDTRDTVSDANDKPVALIELFTSEGCSSCPPADANLKRIATMKGRADGVVIPLSFHVDYWNSLGWKDPFSQEAFSERQRDYARRSMQRGIYTPQMIVNGQYAFNGSDIELSDKAIELALSRPVTHAVELSVVKSKTDDRYVANYSVRLADAELQAGRNTDSDFQVNIAVVSVAESVKVIRGENGGRDLSHVSVVKHFDVRSLDSRNRTFEFDATNVITGNTRVVAYVQSRNSREITGAVVVEL